MSAQLTPVEEWIASRPESVRKLISEFPPGTRFQLDKVFFLIGYTELDGLMLSHIDPALDYDAALAAKVYVCAEHFRK